VNRTATGLLTGLLLAAGMVGCAPARPTIPGPAAAPTTTIVDFATRSGSWPATEDELQNAVNRLDTRCLRTAGFAVPSTPRCGCPSQRTRRP
jgi:hypothetical protein